MTSPATDEVQELAEQGDKTALATVAAYKQRAAAWWSLGRPCREIRSNSAVLEFEKGLSVFFSHGAKKRYIGQVVWPSHEMLVRGYETQRTDSFSYLTTTMKEIFRYTLADQGDALVAYAKQQVEALQPVKFRPARSCSPNCRGVSCERP